MTLSRRLFEAMAPKARQARIDQVCLGIGYTAVTLDDGSIGVAYTYFDHKTGCSLIQEYRDFEDRPAMDLLAHIESQDFLERSMALALINALNQSDMQRLPPDKNNDVLFDALGIGPASKVAMVGLFKPLLDLLQSKGAVVEVIDEFKGMGARQPFYDKLSRWADAALITSTTILNDTLDDILDQAGPKVKAALLGPSTPMVDEAFSARPAVKALAGSVPLDSAAVLKAVRHGLGTPHLHRCSRKVTLTR